ncbi:hypothetical protein [Mesobacillus foraminis]|nr:hypothetical protein [Mesobacillus foraminis]
MNIHDKVLYSGNVYRIIYDYKNGLYEIRRECNFYEVELVSETQICKL